MPVIQDYKQTGDTIQLIAKREDGTIRQVLVQNTKGEVLSRAFFSPDTVMDEEGAWKRKIKYHWIDAFSDEELLDPSNGLSFTEESIKLKRKEAEMANFNKEFVIENLEKYKRK